MRDIDKKAREEESAELQRDDQRLRQAQELMQHGRTTQDLYERDNRPGSSDLLEKLDDAREIVSLSSRTVQALTGGMTMNDTRELLTEVGFKAITDRQRSTRDEEREREFWQ